MAYATLELLEQLGLVRRVRAGSGAVLYDPRAAPHQHAVCRSCGAVEDLDAGVDASGALQAARRAGFAPRRRRHRRQRPLRPLRRARRLALDQQHVEQPRAVHALDPAQLDVRRRTRA